MANKDASFWSDNADGLGEAYQQMEDKLKKVGQELPPTKQVQTKWSPYIKGNLPPSQSIQKRAP